jgi:hypothetical protein
MESLDGTEPASHGDNRDWGRRWPAACPYAWIPPSQSGNSLSLRQVMNNETSTTASPLRNAVGQRADLVDFDLDEVSILQILGW